MEIIGKLTVKLPEQRGESARGTWVRGGFVIETQEQYPRMVAFTMFGEDRIAMLNGINIGTQINVHFSPESREYQGRWYTDLRCIRIDTFVSAGTAPVQPQQPYQAPVQQQPVAAAPAPFASAPAADVMPTEAADDLPF